LLWEELTHGEREEDLEDKYINTSSAAHCGKLRVTKRLLRQFQEAGSKVLLFSFSTKLLDIIEQMVEIEGYIFSRLDGTTPQKARGPMCAKFNVIAQAKQASKPYLQFLPGEVLDVVCIVHVGGYIADRPEFVSHACFDACGRAGSELGVSRQGHYL
jgi:hypothetical protein